MKMENTSIVLLDIEIGNDRVIKTILSSQEIEVNNDDVRMKLLGSRQWKIGEIIHLGP